jgi:hypothetical protein
MLNVFGVRDACLRQPAGYPRNQDEADFLARPFRDDPTTNPRRPGWIDDDYEAYRVLYTEFLVALPTKNEALLDAIMDDLCKNKYVLSIEGRLQDPDPKKMVESTEYQKLLVAMVQSRTAANHVIP